MLQKLAQQLDTEWVSKKAGFHVSTYNFTYLLGTCVFPGTSSNEFTNSRQKIESSKKNTTYTKTRTQRKTNLLHKPTYIHKNRTTVVHATALKTSNNLHSYHNCSDAVYWRITYTEWSTNAMSIKQYRSTCV